jgi:hypothetical protein
MKTPSAKIPPIIHSRNPSFGRCMLGLFLINLIGQLLCEKVLDLLPFDIKKPVEAEIKVDHIQLEKLSKKPL